MSSPIQDRQTNACCYKEVIVEIMGPADPLHISLISPDTIFVMPRIYLINKEYYGEAKLP